MSCICLEADMGASFHHFYFPDHCNPNESSVKLAFSQKGFN